MPSAIIRPQLGVGGCTPMPRKLNELSSTMAVPRPKLTATMTGPSALGTTKERMIVVGGRPSAMAAVT
ncbi:hypothetical protein D3C80_1794870 [compost metagenome]